VALPPQNGGRPGPEPAESIEIAGLFLASWSHFAIAKACLGGAPEPETRPPSLSLDPAQIGPLALSAIDTRQSISIDRISLRLKRFSEAPEHS
jgi:hypothetical protein